MHDAPSSAVARLARMSFLPSNGLTLGLDLGIASVGWSLLDTEGKRFVASGVRVWAAPESPKDKMPLNADRRKKRLLRNSTRHKRQRLSKLRSLFVEHGLLDRCNKDFIPTLVAGGDLKPGFGKSRQENGDQWTLRAEALDRLLSGAELAASLYHIANHRGYRDASKEKSNKDSEGKAVLGALDRNKEAFAKSVYRTAGEWIARDPAFAGKKRNSDGSYVRSITRDMLRDEARLIFRRQRALGGEIANESFEEAFTDVFYNQNPMPSVADSVGSCSFIVSERRTTSFAPSFELKRLLDKLHNLRYGLPGSRYELQFAPDQIRTAATAAVLKFGITYKGLRKLLSIPAIYSFKSISAENETRDICVSSGKGFEGTRALKSALGDTFAKISRSDLDFVAETIAFHEGLDEIQFALSERVLEDALHLIMHAAKDGDFSKFKGTVSVSSEACRRLIPLLEEGMTPYEAEKACGFVEAAGCLPDVTKIGNPVARKALGETIKTVLEIVRAYGRPERIHVELGRDMGKSPEERNEIASGMNKAAKKKEDLRKEFEANAGHEPTGAEFEKYALWKEQDGRCLYSGKGIELAVAIGGGNTVQVDHILPWSRFNDNSWHNKALVLTKMNAEKGNRTPYEFIAAAGGEEAWRDFSTRVSAMSLKGMKKRNLLLVDATEKEEGFRSRNLNDTRYIARVALGLLDCLYADVGTRHVFARQGAMTGLTRRLWDLNGLKLTEDGERKKDDLHHALDAMIVAATDELMMQRISSTVRAAEVIGRVSIFNNAPQPWEGFREDIIAHLAVRDDGKRMLVSRETKTKASGSAHIDTVYSLKTQDDGKSVNDHGIGPPYFRPKGTPLWRVNGATASTRSGVAGRGCTA